MKNKTFIINCLIVLAGALLFIPGIGGSRLFDWDEINFAESAREMLVTGDWLNVRVNFESFWEKPPLFIWMQALSMSVFGVGEFAARFPNALIGIITLLVLFNAGRKAENTRFGLMWALMYLVSFLPFIYFKSGIIDPWYNLFIFLSIYCFALYTVPDQKPRMMTNAALSALFMGLAINTKGPAALLVFGLSFLVWLAFRKFRMDFRWKDVGVYAAVLILTGGAWFLVLALTGHGDIIKDFIDYQVRLFETKDAGHGGFPFYHFVVLFFGVTPASIFALSVFRRSALSGEEKESRMAVLFRWMTVSFWGVLILFSIVRTKIIHYSSFCYFPLSFLAAFAATRMMDGKVSFRGWQKGLLIGISAIFGIAFTGFTLLDRFKHLLIPYIHDPFAVSCMEAEASWMGFEPVIGIVLICCTIEFCVLFSRRKTMSSFVVLALGNLFFLMTALYSAIPEAEKYSQASAVEFYIGIKGEDCYVKPAYFKSYAHYFYTDRKPENACDDFDFLASGPIDKPCYFVVKDIPKRVERLKKDVPEARFLYRRSGFQFFLRPVPGDNGAETKNNSNFEENL